MAFCFRERPSTPALVRSLKSLPTVSFPILFTHYYNKKPYTSVLPLSTNDPPSPRLPDPFPFPFTPSEVSGLKQLPSTSWLINLMLDTTCRRQIPCHTHATTYPHTPARARPQTAFPHVDLEACQRMARRSRRKVNAALPWLAPRECCSCQSVPLA